MVFSFAFIPPVLHYEPAPHFFQGLAASSLKPPDRWIDWLAMVGKSEKLFTVRNCFALPGHESAFRAASKVSDSNNYTFGSFKSKTINKSFFSPKHSFFITRAMRGQGLFMVEDPDRSGLLVMLPSCTLIELTDHKNTTNIYHAQWDIIMFRVSSFYTILIGLLKLWMPYWRSWLM